MRFSEGFLQDLKDRIRLSDLIGRKVALKKQGREFAGLSPFTNEKTPSFFVNDEKAFYHCFSSGNHGDHITWLMETERVAFPEAVKALAEMAGVALPDPDPREAEKYEKRKSLYDLMNATQRFFQTRLSRREGEGAARYLAGRGLNGRIIETFGVGFAPHAWSELHDHLADNGYTVDQMTEAGVLSRRDDGKTYDKFRNRVTFPITDDKERVIAFGGRTLDPDGKPKYLNSPDTPLFHKGSVLYNYAAARRAFGEAERAGRALSGLVVCEGYMDVIAFARAGLLSAVAPLGTALTERQLELLWRVSGAPLLCFDGDAAGRRAAYRAVDRALPLLKPGRTLKFVFLPDGQDPDDVITQQGPGAALSLLNNAASLADVVWRREVDVAPIDTPDGKADLKARLRAIAGQIADGDVREAYRDELMSRVASLRPKASYGQARRGAPNRRNSKQQWGAPEGPSEALKARARMRRSDIDAAQYDREALLLLTAINHPELLDEDCERLAACHFGDGRLDETRRRLLELWGRWGSVDSSELRRHLTEAGCRETLDRLDRHKGHALVSFARPTATLDDAKEGWSKTFLLHEQHGRSLAELRQVAAEADEPDGEGRLKALVAERHLAAVRAGRTEADDDDIVGDI